MEQHPEHSLKRDGFPELVFAAISAKGKPDNSDNPPLHVFTMSLGFLMGRLCMEGHFHPQDAVAAMNWISGKKNVREIEDLIWG